MESIYDTCGDAHLYDSEHLDYLKYKEFLRRANAAIRTCERFGLSHEESAKLVYGAVESRFRTSRTTWVRK
jgi:hypothetical protein